MNIKILYDNRTGMENVKAGWGFSCLVDDRILFDTGESGDGLMANMKESGVDLSRIEKVVISHDHWDHTGGIEDILRERPGMKVFICSGFSEELKQKIRSFDGQYLEAEELTEISQNIFTTGVIKGEYKGARIEEQALVVRTGKGLTVITGCAHPGILNILEIVKKTFSMDRIYCVIGGFHLKNASRDEILDIIQQLKDMGVQKAGPCHCSGDEAIELFEEGFKQDFIDVKAGKERTV